MREETALIFISNLNRKFTKRVQGASLYGYLYCAYDFLEALTDYVGITPQVDERICLYRRMVYDMATYKVATLKLSHAASRRLVHDAYSYLNEACVNMSAVKKGHLR